MALDIEDVSKLKHSACSDELILTSLEAGRIAVVCLSGTPLDQFEATDQSPKNGPV